MNRSLRGRRRLCQARKALDPWQGDVDMHSEGQACLAAKATGFLRRIGLKQGQTVVDFGCSVGSYTKAAARVVGPNG